MVSAEELSWNVRVRRKAECDLRTKPSNPSKERVCAQGGGLVYSTRNTGHGPFS